MRGREPEDWGIPLWEAIERWTPRELWERYRELANHDIPLIMLGSEDPEQDKAVRLRCRIQEILVGKLVGRELIASGIALPLTETSRRRDIRPELWPYLGFGIGFAGVIGSGLRYDGILIREAASGVPATSERASLEQPPYRAAARRGRPSIMPVIEAELRRRAAVGTIEASLAREADVLARWARQQFADAHVPKPKSIRKKLGRVYNELPWTKRPDK